MEQAERSGVDQGSGPILMKQEQGLVAVLHGPLERVCFSKYY